VFLGAGYARDRGLGFSLEAAPSWDADALFQMDKAGTRGNETKRISRNREDYLILWLRSPIYYRGLYIVIDKQ